jgi:hypothetical protein
MGSIKKMLAEANLPGRELHHSRMFIDLAENIHIHYREYRFIFSLPEFFEFSDVLQKSTEDVRNYLEQNKDYKEQEYPTTLIVAGGRERQLKYLKNSPKSNESFYLNDKLTIELQEEYVTDEIHIHYRDFRLGIDRERFKILALNFKKALENLESFEKNNKYERKKHSDRAIDNFNDNDKEIDYFPYVSKVKLELIKSFRNPNFPDKWKGNYNYIENLKKEYERNKNNLNISPIILTKKDNGIHYIIDGHHRYLLHKKLGIDKINSVITNLSFEQSEKLRIAENNLKLFDNQTNDEFGVSDFYKSFIAYKLNQHYNSHYRKAIFKNTKIYKFLRKIKQLIFGKEYIFKNFFESYNKPK